MTTHTQEASMAVSDDELAGALAALTDVYLDEHGCFPLDEVTPKQRAAKEAMKRAYALIGQPGTPDREQKLARLRETGAGKARPVAHVAFGPLIEVDWVDPDQAVRLKAGTPLFLSALTQPQADEVTEAARDVLAERRRQVEAEGWTPEHDDAHRQGTVTLAAASYALSASDSFSRFTIHDLDAKEIASAVWPWERRWFKDADKPRRKLVKAAALILAEIERLDRAALQAKSQPEGGE